MTPTRSFGDISNAVSGFRNISSSIFFSAKAIYTSNNWQALK